MIILFGIVLDKNGILKLLLFIFFIKDVTINQVFYTGRPKKVSHEINKKYITPFFLKYIVCVSLISSPSNTLYFTIIDHLIAEIWSI